MALQFASKELRADRDVVTEAVNQDGLALQYASKRLQADLELLEIADRSINNR